MCQLYHQHPLRVVHLITTFLATATFLIRGTEELRPPKYSLNVVHTKYGPLRGILVQPLHHSELQVEAYLGIPYATPPIGSLRYMPPVTPSMWKEVRIADKFAPVCPQQLPDISNRTEALLQLPRGRLVYLEKLLPLLANESEDCLYMNIYVPQSESEEKLPVILYIHGESYEWSSGNPYDGSVLAAYGHLIVVTINFRLGILGFLKTGAKGSTQGNFGLMDLIAGLHWLRENIPAFRGDPENITVMGHGTGAALANFIAVSPVARDLSQRAILLSGSGLSPWAVQRDPLAVKRRVAEQTSCHGDLVEDDLAPCLRLKSLDDLLAVNVDTPRFLAGFAPFIDGAVLPNSLDPSVFSGVSMQQQIVTPQQGSGGYHFHGKSLLVGVTSTESYWDLSAQDLEFGFNETRRDRILRTFVRNCYFYHLNEIFSTLKNEYTDWEKPMQNPLSVRDSILEVLSDGHTVAPLIRMAFLHALRGSTGKTFFLHFNHQTTVDRDFPQRTGSVRGEDVPYVLGLPLVGGQPFFLHNYTRIDTALCKQLIHYISNFAKKGDPNDPGKQRPEPPVLPGHILISSSSSNSNHRFTNTFEPYWDTFDSINQLYLEMGTKTEMKNHYRGHKMSLWLNLIPQLHRPGFDDLNMRHHHFSEEGAQFYDGSVRPQTLHRPTSATSTSPPTMSSSSYAIASSTPLAALLTTTECPPNVTGSAVSQNTQRPGNNYNLFRKLATSHYQSYTMALTVTIGVGCLLLLLNVTIFALIYRKRDRGDNRNNKDDAVEVGSCSSSSGDVETKQQLIHHHQPSRIGHKLPSSVDMPLREFQCSPHSVGSGIKRASCSPPSYELPPELTSSSAIKKSQHLQQQPTTLQSPQIPEPPPPPRTHPPIGGGGILRQTAAPAVAATTAMPQTPASSKKRVQIQEVSV